VRRCNIGVESTQISGVGPIAPKKSRFRRRFGSRRVIIPCKLAADKISANHIMKEPGGSHQAQTVLNY